MGTIPTGAKPQEGESGPPSQLAQLELLSQILLTGDRLADKLMYLADRLDELAQLSSFLLDRHSVALMEKSIHQELERYAQEEKNRQRLGRKAAGGFEIADRAEGAK